MARKFANGEIVIFVPDFRGEPRLVKYAGEVEIRDYDDWFEMYDVWAPDGQWFIAHECVLRKRPQPPDWNQLSTPTEAPREVICA